MEPFIGQIQLFAFDFAPTNWALCNGQLLSTAQYSALYKLIGTTYGGDGITTFSLPDLRGRAPIHFGQGPGLSDYGMGEASGTENVTLLSTQMPQHNHPMAVSSQLGDQLSPVGHILAVAGLDGMAIPGYGTNPNATADPRSIGMAGSNQPHPNMQPYLTMNYCIALYGIYPSQS